MGARMSYDLSDGLQALRQRFRRLEECGGDRLLGEHEIAEMVAGLEALHALALGLEHQLSRKLWNAEAKKDRLRNAALMSSAITAPGSNVMLFPVVPRQNAGAGRHG